MLIKRLSTKIVGLVLVAFLGLNTAGCGLGLIDFEDKMQSTTEIAKE